VSKRKGNGAKVSRILVDSSAWIALVRANDLYHSQARSRFNHLKQQRAKLFISEYIFLEVVTVLLMRVGPVDALSIGRLLQNSQIVQFLYIDPELVNKTWQVFQTQAMDPNRQASFTDCSSVVLIQEHRLDHIFTFDRVFERLGLPIL
jgi:predicted nucleic acid-binding protein